MVSKPHRWIKSDCCWAGPWYWLTAPLIRHWGEWGRKLASATPRQQSPGSPPNFIMFCWIDDSQAKQPWQQICETIIVQREKTEPWVSAFVCVCVCVKEQSTVLFHVLLLVTHTHNEGEARTHSSKVNSSGTRVGSHTDLRLEVCGQRWILVKEQKLNWKNKCVKHQLHTNVSHSSVQPGRKG